MGAANAAAAHQQAAPVNPEEMDVGDLGGGEEEGGGAGSEGEQGGEETAGDKRPREGEGEDDMDVQVKPVPAAVFGNLGAGAEAGPSDAAVGALERLKRRKVGS